MLLAISVSVHKRRRWNSCVASPSLSMMKSIFKQRMSTRVWQLYMHQWLVFSTSNKIFRHTWVPYLFVLKCANDVMNVSASKNSLAFIVACHWKARWSDVTRTAVTRFVLPSWVMPMPPRARCWNVYNHPDYSLDVLNVNLRQCFMITSFMSWM